MEVDYVIAPQDYSHEQRRDLQDSINVLFTTWKLQRRVIVLPGGSGVVAGEVIG